MLRTPESILRSPPVKDPPLKEVGDDGTNTKTLSTNIDLEILRNMSTETQSTDYSSGIHSLDLLMEVYPSISDSESEKEKSLEDENDNNTVVHINTASPKRGSQQEDDVEDNLSFFNLGFKKGVTSLWSDDRPFDEESLRALSERGEGAKVYSKGFDSVEEYILPPATYPEKIVGISADKGPIGKVNWPITKTRSTSPTVNTLTSEYGNQDESVNRSFQKKDKDKAPNKESKKVFGVSKKCFWMACISAICMLAVAILLGFLTSRTMRENNASSNQTTAASNEDPSSPSAPLPSTNITEELGDDDRPWGDLITYLDPIPDESFPLGLCAGDCDRDADCAEGLVCYQRGANDPVPFCFGGENDDSRNDYCTYPSFSGEMPGSESDECEARVSVAQECFFDVDNVIVVNFENCNPEAEDWVGVFPDTPYDDESPGTELVGNNFINWAFTCGDIDCEGSPFTNSFGFPTEYNDGFEFPLLRAYLLRNNLDGPQYEVIAKSEPFVPTQICE